MNEGFPLRRPPLPAMIDIWMIDLDRPLSPGANLDDILSIEERKRADRYLFSRDALRFRLCRAMLRLGLAGYLEMAPEKIVLTTNGRGKPRVAGSGALNFNVSHSGGLGLIAYTTAGEVGVDVEAIRGDIETLEIASAHFTKEEAAMVEAAATPAEQAAAFLRLWTRKEAVLKAAGYGLLGGLDRADVSQGPSCLARLRGATEDSAESCWRVEDLELTDGFAGAVAAPAGNWSVVLRPVGYEDAISGFAGGIAGIL